MHDIGGGGGLVSVRSKRRKMAKRAVTPGENIARIATGTGADDDG